MPERYNIFSFFAGAGFLDLGFELSNHYNIVYVNEFSPTFNRIYQYSREQMHLPAPQFGHHVGDITQLLNRGNLENLQELVDDSRQHALTGFIGGPPCPDFSIAGKQAGKEGENGKLSGTYCSLICRTHPDFFLFENVKGLYRTAKHRAFFDQLKRRFRRAGYCLTEQLINALEFGVPQERERIILIGVREDVCEMLHIPINRGKLIDFDWNAYKLFDVNAVKQMPWPDETPYVQGGALAMPQGIEPTLTVQHWWDQNDVLHHPNANMFFQPRAGLAHFNVDAEGDCSRKSYKRIHRWRYSPTAAYGNNEVHVHPYQPRRISVAEALAIQSLPAAYSIPQDITLSDAFKTIGNGVPFLAAQGIANTLYDFLTR
ncbi:DNA (cytosine-5)-methyltransferase 1 [Bacteroidales bacterium WCE2004]|nr:DNA (cytosine-5)-methyltransferase 1 [Bacteroidales bacterium WCE2004]